MICLFILHAAPKRSGPLCSGPTNAMLDSTGKFLYFKPLDQTSNTVPYQQVRLRPSGTEGGFPPALTFLRPGLPGPQLIPPPPPKPQPVVLSAAPKLYKQPKEDEEKKEKESRKRVRQYFC